ncbi:MgtC/SapB family protein [Enterococcus sp. LJL99]
MVDYQVILLRLFLATLIGGAVGYERASNNSVAGLRTHILVAVSLAGVSLIQVSIVDTAVRLVAGQPELQNLFSVDFGRLGAQAIAGVGFLGAGTILQMKNGVVGLTTAASIWSVAVIGLAIGMGYYFIGILLGGIVVLTLGTMNRVSKKYLHKPTKIIIDVEFLHNESLVTKLNQFFGSYQVEIEQFELIEQWDHEKSKARYVLILDRYHQLDELKNKLYSLNTRISSVKSYGL